MTRCGVCDGNESCVLPARHPLPHMGRWYTMKLDDIFKFEDEMTKLWADPKFAPTQENKDALSVDGR